MAIRPLLTYADYAAIPNDGRRYELFEGEVSVTPAPNPGHQEIIGHTVKRARDLGVQSVVVTFDPHPAEVVRPGSHPAVLTEPARKAELIVERAAPWELERAGHERP